MRLDSLQRLIEGADYMAFRELAISFLELKGYRHVALADGWRDGGTDVRLYESPPNPTPIAFQITVERDWKSKLLRDAKKVKADLKLQHMTLVSARRVPEAEFHSVSESIWSDLGVRVTRYDCQSIATAFAESAKSVRVLEILGLPIASSGALASSVLPAKDSAVYAYSYFANDATEFKESTIRGALISVLADSQSASRQTLIDRAAQQLGFAGPQVRMLEAATDRMLQAADIVTADGQLSLADALSNAAQAMSLAREAGWSALRRDVAKAVNEYGGITAPSGAVVEQIVKNLGGLALDVARDSSVALSISSKSSGSKHVRARLQNLHAVLDGAGVHEGSARNVLLESLARITAGSSIGKCLMAGELFLLLSGGSATQLAQALGGRSHIRVLLDASVAIPMLGGLLYVPAQSSFALAADHCYKHLAAHGMAPELPEDYLEETATHLIRAFSDYAPFVDSESDLALSTNAFVAHYAYLRKHGECDSFSDYMDAFGYREHLRKAAFEYSRPELQRHLQRLFDRYGIKPVRLGSASVDAIRRAEECVSHALHELGLTRPRVLLQHDVGTIAYMIDEEKSGERANVLCTWDRLHLAARGKEGAEWQVLSPATLGDLLALTRPSSSDLETTASAVVVAKSMGEDTAARGAEVWDAIARLESGKLSDARLLEQARKFKEAWLSNASFAGKSLEQEWARWRQQNYRAGAAS